MGSHRRRRRRRRHRRWCSPNQTDKAYSLCVRKEPVAATAQGCADCSLRSRRCLLGRKLLHYSDHRHTHRRSPIDTSLKGHRPVEREQVVVKESAFQLCQAAPSCSRWRPCLLHSTLGSRSMNRHHTHHRLPTCSYHPPSDVISCPTTKHEGLATTADSSSGKVGSL